VSLQGYELVEITYEGQELESHSHGELYYNIENSYVPLMRLLIVPIGTPRGGVPTEPPFSRGVNNRSTRVDSVADGGPRANGDR
jgi:hypothetical protein